MKKFFRKKSLNSKVEVMPEARCCKKCGKKLKVGDKHKCCEFCRGQRVGALKKVGKACGAVGVFVLNIVVGKSFKR